MVRRFFTFYRAWVHCEPGNVNPLGECLRLSQTAERAWDHIHGACLPCCYGIGTPFLGPIYSSSLSDHHPQTVAQQTAKVKRKPAISCPRPVKVTPSSISLHPMRRKDGRKLSGRNKRIGEETSQRARRTHARTRLPRRRLGAGLAVRIPFVRGCVQMQRGRSGVVLRQLG